MAKTVTKIGIADCHGIESYLDKDGNEKKLMILVMRSNANRHRHAVTYEIVLSKATDQMIESLLRQQKYEKALRILKERALQTKLAAQGGVEKSWDLIPNPALDPYRD